MRVKFRTASSFLVSYSVNISRGGMFLEVATPTEIGQEVQLRLEVENRQPIEVPGRVAWRRDTADAGGPSGIGIEFTQASEPLGMFIDELVSEFTKTKTVMRVLLVAPNPHDAMAVVRMVKSTISSAEVVTATTATTAARILGTGIELAVLDASKDATTAMLVIENAKKTGTPLLPTVVLTSDPDIGQRALASGAHEVVKTDAPHDLSRALVRALGRPQVQPET
jgi:uncharacterized protein (TIGR02266 family)